MTKLSIGHVSMVPDDLADMFRWHVFLLSIHKPKFSLFRVAFRLQLLPFPCCRVRRQFDNKNYHTHLSYNTAILPTLNTNALSEIQHTFLLQFFLRHEVWDRCRRGNTWWHPCRDSSVGEGSCHGASQLQTSPTNKELE